MRSSWSLLLVAPPVALVLAVGCSSSSPPTTGADSGASDATVEAAADAAVGPVPSGACVAKRAATGAECDADCDVRLTLPANDRWCSLQCATNADCATLGADIICPDTIGACVPRCTADASCKAAGFKRCDLTVGACDTL